MPDPTDAGLDATVEPEWDPVLLDQADGGPTFRIVAEFTYAAPWTNPEVGGYEFPNSQVFTASMLGLGTDTPHMLLRTTKPHDQQTENYELVSSSDDPTLVIQSTPVVNLPPLA